MIYVTVFPRNVAGEQICLQTTKQDLGDRKQYLATERNSPSSGCELLWNLLSILCIASYLC